MLQDYLSLQDSHNKHLDRQYLQQDKIIADTALDKQAKARQILEQINSPQNCLLRMGIQL